MASFVTKIVAKKILGETVDNKFGKKDPYFETIPATRLDGTPSKRGKTKKRKKALPPGISEHDGQVLTKVKRRAYRLDMCLFSFLGIKFGWGSVIGIIPAIGDVLDALLALMVMKTCGQIEGGLPAGLKAQMMFNIIIDFVIGLVPFFGDIADAAFRANTRNAMVLEEHLRRKGKKNLEQSGQLMPAVDPSSPEEFDRSESNNSPENGPHSSTQQPSARPGQPRSQHPMPSEPEVAEVRGGGWRNKTRANDIEMGRVDNSGSDGRKKTNKSGRR
ncbi:hypothetical protein ACO1O0_008071 [Amphichorda felina]